MENDKTYAPNQIDYTLFQKAEQLQKENKFEEAAEIWAQMAREAIDQTGFLCNYAYCMMVLGKFERALPAIKQILTLEPDNDIGLEHLKMLLPKLTVRNSDIETAMMNLTRSRRHNDIGSCLFRLRDIGFNPKHVLDIGANQGEWAKIFGGIFIESNVTMLEAQEKMRPQLQKFCDSNGERFKFHITLLGDEDNKEVEFFEHEDDATGSSIFSELTTAGRKTIKLQMHKLDSVLADNPILKQDFEMLKLDVQGAELMILEGAKETLKTVDFINMEVSVLQYNKGAPLFADVVAYMKRIGFMFIDVAEIVRYVSRVPMQVDLLFVREESKWPQRILEFIPNLKI